jgi:hypothetical protein
MNSRTEVQAALVQQFDAVAELLVKSWTDQYNDNAPVEVGFARRTTNATAELLAICGGDELLRVWSVACPPDSPSNNLIKFTVATGTGIAFADQIFDIDTCPAEIATWVWPEFRKGVRFEHFRKSLARKLAASPWSGLDTEYSLPAGTKPSTITFVRQDETEVAVVSFSLEQREVPEKTDAKASEGGGATQAHSSVFFPVAHIVVTGDSDNQLLDVALLDSMSPADMANIVWPNIEEALDDFRQFFLALLEKCRGVYHNISFDLGREGQHGYGSIGVKHVEQHILTVFWKRESTGQITVRVACNKAFGAAESSADWLDWTYQAGTLEFKSNLKPATVAREIWPTFVLGMHEHDQHKVFTSKDACQFCAGGNFDLNMSDLDDCE